MKYITTLSIVAVLIVISGIAIQSFFFLLTKMHPFMSSVTIIMLLLRILQKQLQTTMRI